MRIVHLTKEPGLVRIFEQRVLYWIGRLGERARREANCRNLNWMIPQSHDSGVEKTYARGFLRD
jgi:hypothetical protein